MTGYDLHVLVLFLLQPPCHSFINERNRQRNVVRAEEALKVLQAHVPAPTPTKLCICVLSHSVGNIIQQVYSN